MKGKYKNMIDEKCFIKNIVKKNYISVISQLQQEKLPLIVWGNGDVAHEVIHWLENYNVCLAGILVDKQVKNINNCSLPVYNIKTLKDKFIAVNVIIGHSHYEKGKKLLEYNTQIKKVFCISGIGYEQREFISYNFVLEHQNQYQISYNILEDILSKKYMCAYINTRVNDDINYILSCKIENYNLFENDILKISNNESYVDIGAYDGDTIKQFLTITNNGYNKIFAFEPDIENFTKLKDYIEERNITNIICFNKGTWNKKEILRFSDGKEQRSSIIFTNGIVKKIEADRLDNLCKEKITLIKINFLYGLQETLMGAEEILKRYYPKLVITVGFDEWALINIPTLIKNIAPNYKIYLRFLTAMPARLVLYAVSK